MAVPNVSYKVEIAWTSNWLTPAASRAWTDVSAYVELQETMKIDYGRGDELSTADANSLSLTLDNRDGRFTWGNAASPYYPNVKIGKPIRVTATVGGVDYVRFVGLVNEWPVEWPGESAGFAQASITASSRMARLGLASPLRNAIDETMTLAEPDHYWPLTEPAGSSQGADAAIPPAPFVPRTAASVFGVGVDGDPMFELDGRAGVHLVGAGNGNAEYEANITADLPGSITIGPGAPGGVTLSFFARVTNPNDPGVFASGRLAAFYDKAVGYDSITDEYLAVALGGGGYNVGAGGFGSRYGGIWPTDLSDDGALRHLAVTIASDGTNLTVVGYFDGASAGSDTRAAITLVMNRLTIWSPAYSMLVGRVALWDRALSAGEVAELAASGPTGFSGDTTDERLQRYAAWARIPSAEVIASASPVTLAGTQADAAQVEALMRQVETAEAGVLYEDRTGNLVLKRRSARYNVSPALTVAFTGDLVKGYAPKVDRTGLANIGTGRGPDGSEAAYQNAASRDEYGDADCSVETTALDPDEPLQLVAWTVNAKAQPRPRVPAPQFSVIDFIGGSIAALLALDVGSKLRLTNAPAQAPGGGGIVDYFVEGYTEEMGVGTWSISPNLSPVTLEDTVLILDDAVEGLLDTNILAL